MQRSAKIVVDGGVRLRKAGGYEDERRRLRAELMQRFEGARAYMTWWGRLCLEIELRRAVRTELNKKFPPGALHLVA
jgi:hypothetical protein